VGGDALRCGPACLHAESLFTRQLRVRRWPADLEANRPRLSSRPLRPVSPSALPRCSFGPNEYRFCEPYGRFLCLNSGMILFQPTANTELALRKMLIALTNYWDSWWEQTLFNWFVGLQVRRGRLTFDYLEPTLFQWASGTPSAAKGLAVSHTPAPWLADRVRQRLPRRYWADSEHMPPRADAPQPHNKMQTTANKRLRNAPAPLTLPLRNTSTSTSCAPVCASAHKTPDRSEKGTGDTEGQAETREAMCV